MRDVTNAERIRGMSDQELVRLIMCWCPPEMDWSCAKGFNGYDGCEECWAKWLQQPAETTAELPGLDWAAHLQARFLREE